MFKAKTDNLEFFCLGILLLCSCTIAIPSPVAIPPSLSHTKAAYWDDKQTNIQTGSLIFVGQDPNTAYNYIPDTNTVYSAEIDSGGSIAFIIPLKDPLNYVIGLDASLKTFSWDGMMKNKISLHGGSIDLDTPLVAGNVDANGRLWVATENSKLYIINGNCFTEQLANAGMPYGFAWSRYGKKMYVIDSGKSLLLQYGFTMDSGSVESTGELVFNFTLNGFDGMPKAIYVDDKNHAWVALYGSNKIAKIDPQNGALVTTVEIPDTPITSLAFGGSNMDILYVTTDKNTTSVDSGCLFQVNGIESKGLVSKAANMKPLTD